jgi:hypothetical protein
MMSCAQIDRVEELALGLLERADAAEVRAHLEACATCREAQEMFTEERALFEQRAHVFERPSTLSAARAPAPAPYFAPAVVPINGAAPVTMAPLRAKRDAWLASASRSLVAVAACAAAVAGIVKIETRPTRPITVSNASADMPIQTDDPSMVSTRSTFEKASMASRSDDALACALPASALVSRVTSMSAARTDDDLACESVHATCEESVTSSVATP